MATLLLKASNKEQHSVIHFLWVKGLRSNAIHSEMRLGDNCFITQAIHVWCKKFAQTGESIAEKK